jgi:cyclic pyranopterin phosphate synthase
MNRRVVPIVEQRRTSIPAPLVLQPPSGLLVDRLARELRDLRISVTDRCNFRCQYCMPRAVFAQDYPFLPRTELLSFDEIERLARLFVDHGVTKLRITGGEPLLRRNLEQLISQLAKLRSTSGEAVDLTLTTNGSLLARKAATLKSAGLTRVTVSLDALDDSIFKRMNDAEFSVDDVLQGIEAAAACGLGPVKVNMVVQRGVNEAQILPMARYFRGTPHVLRFIEYMDVGHTNGWCSDEVLSSAQVISIIDRDFPLEAMTASYRGEVAQRWRYRDGGGEIGVISSVTQPFCGDCTRARISPEGRLYTCLFANRGTDLRAPLRQGASDELMSSLIRDVWEHRIDRYSEVRSEAPISTDKIEMSYIGG